MPAVAIPEATFRVNEIVLFESRLHPKGARYEAVQRSQLAV